MKNRSISRRRFLQRGSLLSTLPLLPAGLDFQKAEIDPEGIYALSQFEEQADAYVQPLDLAPARWIWYPSQRTLPNTFILFRRVFRVERPVASATGWILGDSRYKLYHNGERLQFGPAPSDPRYSEADPVDLTERLQPGEHVLGAEVLYYGFGDGTWPIGKPGFIFRLDITYEDGTTAQIISDDQWHAQLCRAWPPGQYKRWYLRALQEDFDARNYPYGWTKPDYEPDDNWIPSMDIFGQADQTALATRYGDYLMDSSALATPTQLRARSVLPLLEREVPAWRLAEAFEVEWKRPPREYFELLFPDAYTPTRTNPVQVDEGDRWEVKLEKGKGAVLTFEFREQIVGFPYFNITAPAGTTIELMVQEGHATGKGIVMNNHFHAWTRFTCREGENRFETFDYESLRWLQLHITGTGRAVIERVGVRRRRYPWPRPAQVFVSDPKIQMVLEAAVNTLHNAAQETIVDGMGRERQQYSGDVGHALHAILFTFGDTRIPARFVNTYSQGLTKDGYFLDSWPAYDRLARLPERQLDLTPWGPLLDHSIGFNFDCYYYYLYTGDLEPLREVYPRLLVFFDYLRDFREDDGLLPVEDIGIPWIWMDTDSYREQRHKQCAFNLYAAAMLQHALGPLARAFEDGKVAEAVTQFGRELEQATIARFYDPARRRLIINWPWLAEEGQALYCERSLSTALLFDQLPPEGAEEAVRILVDKPPALGRSYPANAGWHLWALAKAGRVDEVLDEWRERWFSMASVQQNNTLQEAWRVAPDSGSQWSHIPVAPLYVLFMSVAGIQPLVPGFSRVLIRPQPGDLERVDLTANTVKGLIRFQSEGARGDRRLTLHLPEGMEGVLEVPEGEKLELPQPEEGRAAGRRRYRLEGGREVSLRLKVL